MQAVPGSHKQGLINPDHASGFLTKPMDSLAVNT
jgi:hypothetical protein